MAVIGRVKVDIRGLKQTRLLILELTELEKDLSREEATRPFASRLNHALNRYSKSINHVRNDLDDDT